MKYLLAIVAAALAVSLAASIPQKKSIKQIVTLLGGAILLIALIRPVISLHFGDLEEYLSRFEPDEALISGALQQEQNETSALITQATREYILDKARELGASVEVEIELAALSDSYQYPYRVRLTGTWTVGQRQELSEYISQTLGIPEERQIWNED